MTKIHEDQLVIVLFDTDEENGTQKVIYQHRDMFYGFVFNKKGEIKSMIRNEDEQEIIKKII